MKARQDFEIVINSAGKRISYREGEDPKPNKIIKIKVGDLVPEAYIHDLLMYNPELLEVEFENGRHKLSEQQKKKYGFADVKIKPEVKKLYTQEGLLKLRKGKGFKALKKIGKLFGVTDRSTTKLIKEILIEQNKE